MDITVAGQGRASLAPERATLHLVLGFEGGDPQAALRETTALVLRVTAQIDQLKQAEPSPTTWSAVLPIHTRSWRPWSDKGKINPMRYAASCVVQVKFRDFSALSRFVSDWAGTQGVTVSHVEWALTEGTRKELEAQVLAQAVEQARERAQTIATAGGAGEVRVVEVADPGLLTNAQVDAGPITQAVALRGASGGAPAGDEAIELAPEDIEITAILHARFTTS